MRLDLKDKMENDYYNPENEKKLKKSFYFLGFIVSFVVIFSATLIIAGEGSDSFFGKIPFLGKFLGSGQDSLLTGEKDDRINVLLLGMGGKGHDGAYLTDTIILASFKPSLKKVALYSIPRDLVVPVNGRWVKINSVNSTAIMSDKEGGQVLADALSEVLALDINYYALVDFKGFIGIIDELGGIEVEVDNVLSDRMYPIMGQEANPDYYARYEHLYISTGNQKMDGSLALKYARSRYAGGVEGSDFARARRQQKVLEAVKSKLMKKENLLRPLMLAKILDEFNDNVYTNIKIFETLRFWNLFKDINREDISNYVLDDAPRGFLYSSIGEDGAFILIPKAGNFKEISYFMENSFSALGHQAEPVAIVSQSQIPESAYLAVVEVKNGTNVDGLAAKMAFSLRQKNFSILKISNATERDLLESIIYDLSYGKKKEALETVKKELPEAEVVRGLPEPLASSLKNDISVGLVQKSPDFVIILGEDYSR